MIKYQPYFYIVGWPQLDWYYAGIEVAEKSKIAHPDNLFRISGTGTRYTTSSKHVHKLVRFFGDPQFSEIHECDNANQARELEVEFLKEADIFRDKRWLNRAIGTWKTVQPWNGAPNPKFLKVQASLKQSDMDGIVAGLREAVEDIKVRSANYVKGIREKTNLSQRGFADRYHLNLRTLQGWEKGKPLDSNSKVLLKLIDRDPVAVDRMLNS